MRKHCAKDPGLEVGRTWLRRWEFEVFCYVTLDKLLHLSGLLPWTVDIITPPWQGGCLEDKARVTGKELSPGAALGC